MTYQEKIDWLLGYREQKEKIHELDCELKEMQEIMQEQREFFADSQGDWKRTCQEKEARAVKERELVLAKEQRKLMAMNDAIESAIQRLDDTRQRRVMRMIYIGGRNQDQVCEKANYCKRNISRIHSDAVNTLQLRPEELQAGMGVGKSAGT